MEISETKLGDLGTMSGIEGDSSDEVVLPAGKVVAERFEIVGVIGRGGMGTVYEVYDQNREEQIALKFLRPEYVSSDNARQRFLNEAKIAISLSHPHIISVYDVVKYVNTCFLTMELLKGQNLRQRLQELAKSGQMMPLDEAVTIIKDLCEALAYAHKSTIHRDIKPENIWILLDGRAKLMDFGIARLQDQTSNLTKTTSVLGTAYYMAPEQLVGAGQVDHRADQYSLGVVFYEMLTGRLPIGKVKPVKEIRPHIHKAVDVVIETMLAGNAGDRYSNDAACLKALDALSTSEKPSNLGRILAGAAAVVVVGAAAAYFVSRPAAPPDLVESEAQAETSPASTLSNRIAIPENGELTEVGFRSSPSAQLVQPFAKLAKEEAAYRPDKPSFTTGILKGDRYTRGSMSFNIACVDFDASIEGNTHALRVSCKANASECVSMSNGKFDGAMLTKFDVPEAGSARDSGIMQARAVLVEMQKGRSCTKKDEEGSRAAPQAASEQKMAVKQGKPTSKIASKASSKSTGILRGAHGGNCIKDYGCQDGLRCSEDPQRILKCMTEEEANRAAANRSGKSEGVQCRASSECSGILVCSKDRDSVLRCMSSSDALAAAFR